MSGIRRIIAWGLLAGSLGLGRVTAAPLDPTLPLFTAQSQGDVSLASGSYAFTLGTNAPSLTFYNGQVFTTVATGFVYNGINVFDFHSLNIAAGANISVTQSSASGPIALLSSTSINMGGSIDVSAASFFGFGGPGAANTSTGGNGSRGTSPGGAGPGAVLVSGGGGGGFGGVGMAGQDTPIVNAFTRVQVGTLPGGAGGSHYESLADQLRGGSMGGIGGALGGSSPFGPNNPGLGGGAIELGAVQTVSVSGTIKANGSNANSTPYQFFGGSGGGSGGGVLLHGDSVSLSGTISALGGAGGPAPFVYGSGGVGSGGLVLAEYNGPYGSFTNTGTVNVGTGLYAGRFDVASVPEPSSLILFGMSALGGVALTGWRHRSRRRAAKLD